MGNGVMFFISALGAFNGLVLGIYVLFFSRTRKVSNYFLGALLIALSLRIGKSVLYYFDTSLLRVYLQIGLSACWFIGPCILYYIKAEKESVKAVPRTWIGVIVVLALIMLTVGLIYPYQQYPEAWGYIVRVIYVQWGLFLILSLYELKDVIKKVAHPSQLKSADVWLM